MRPSIPPSINRWLLSTSALAGREVTDVSARLGRRPSALLTLDDGSVLFVKAPSGISSDPAGRRELELLDAIETRGELAAVRETMPRVHAIDRESRIIVTEGLASYSTLRTVAGGGPPTGDALLSAIARALALCHRVARTDPLGAETRIQAVPPPVILFDRMTPTRFAEFPGHDAAAFIAAVQTISPQLQAMKNRWVASTLIHGDIKDDNLLVWQQINAGRLDVKLVDWEIAGWGDPMWDAGSFIGIILTRWVNSINPRAGSDLGTWIAGADVNFQDVRASCAGFLRAYWEARHIEASTPEALLPAVIEYAGIYLLHRAQATLLYHGVLPVPAHLYLQLSRILISEPVKAATLLFPSCGL